MKLPKLIILMGVLISSQFSFAQTATKYVIQLGNSSASTDELGYLSDISNVYFQASTNLDNKKVTLGAFSDLQKAEAITQNLRGVSFPNAYIEPLAEEKGKDVFVIKLAEFDSHDAIDWSKCQLNKKIYTSIDNDKYKVFTGIFPDYDAALPFHNKLFQLGFINAEVIKINSIYLHNINKIDIAYQQSLHTRNLSTTVKEFTTKGAAASISNPQAESKENIPPLVNRVALSKSIAPAINEKLARISVKNLQSILSVYGNYASEPNGIYDAKTANSYYATIQLTPSLKKFNDTVESKAHITSGYFTDWSDVELLLNISEHITGTSKEHFGDAQLKALVSLYNNPKVLSSSDAQKVHDWIVSVNTQMQNMKAEGSLDSATLQAYMLVSTKVQVLLEDYFLNKGFQIDEATNLAKATMYAMLVGSFQAI